MPVIATGWSAHTEFMNLGKYIKVDYSLEKIHQTRVDNQIFMPEAKWAVCSEQDAKRKMRKFYESPKIPTEWALSLQNIIQNKYNAVNIAKQYDEFLLHKLTC